MGKILGKSMLCFAGLVVASWLLLQLDNWMIWKWENITSEFLVLFKVIVLMNILWFFVAIAYAYILFRLFNNKLHCFLIVAMNGLFIFILYFALLFLQVDFDILTLALSMVQADSISVMALALMFKIMSVKGKAPKKSPGRATNILLIFLKSAAGICIFTILAILADTSLHYVPFVFLVPFQNARFVFLLTSIIYAGVLYILFSRHKHSILIIIANAVIIASFWFLILVPDMPYSLFNFPLLSSFTFCGLAGNTAIITIALAFIFRSVEKHSRFITSANPPQAQSIETPGSTGLPVQ